MHTFALKLCKLHVILKNQVQTCYLLHMLFFSRWLLMRILLLFLKKKLTRFFVLVVYHEFAVITVTWIRHAKYTIQI
ncbi:MAG: hypothetical protein EA001_09030 [Oscillatoriales cyanobacterium]|nr:MAG: hypothetical protein EA001_09030 [Oscillatoriales cyanobacterium]